MTNERKLTSQVVMTWLFKLNLGILFAAFSAISFWTQGVPRKLATLAGFVAGLLFLAFLTLDFLVFHLSRVSRPRIRPLALAVVWLVALASGWPLIVATANTDWVYQHAARAVLCGVAWSLQAMVWFGVCYPALRCASVAWWDALAETCWFAGVILQFLAATLIAGAPWMWPGHTREHAVDWYVWLSQGYAMSLLALGFLTTQLAGGGPRLPGWIRLPVLTLLVAAVATFWLGLPGLPWVRALGHLMMIGGFLTVALAPRENDERAA